MQTYLVLLHEGTTAQPVMSPEEMQAVIARATSLAAKTGEIARLAQGTGAAAYEAMDDQLAMIFLCCHPDVPREGRVALTLKTYAVSAPARSPAHS